MVAGPSKPVPSPGLVMLSRVPPGFLSLVRFHQEMMEKAEGSGDPEHRTQDFLPSPPQTSLHRLAIPLSLLWPEKPWLHWNQLGTIGSPAPANASSTEITGLKEDKTAVSTAQRKDNSRPLTSGAWRMGAETLSHV